MQSKRGCNGLWIAVLAAVADRFTKVAASRLQSGTALLPGLVSICPTVNTGVAFSMLSGGGLALTAFTAALVALLAGWLIFSKKPQPAGLRAGLWLIVGGGLGNLYDRVAYGHVIDFINLDFVRFAVFNVADIAVCAGAAVVILSVLLSDRRKEPEHV